ncbi:aldo/keto reductase [Faecalibaculum rodentium]|jgi:predicted oxidoreductase|uniref:aldo/keto reductase n=1 Tax=Faecalibaculum rodentium TaxID=1702221 RepID=UPI001F58BC6B|nr:aldo/keto reductase [Faecalibaculum rodentium]
MQNILLRNTLPEAGQIIVGCMRMDSRTPQELANMIDDLADRGIRFYDHADIYGHGKCEELFGEAMQLANTPREDLIIQSKCGIRDGWYDLSKDYILDSVDGILNRLQTPYLDLLILHRPDALMEPKEIAEAFDQLQKSGKVRHFGVSNFTPEQIRLLQTEVKQPLLVNQLQLSIPNAWMISQGLEANMPTQGALDRTGHVLEQMRQMGITIQTWSPLQYGDWEGTFLDNPIFAELNETLQKLADKYNVSKSAIAAAWILRHPAGMQVVTGSSRTDRILEMARARKVDLTRKEWYDLYRAAGHRIP